MVSSKKINDFYHKQDTPQNMEELLSFLMDITERHVHGLRDNDIFENGQLVQSKSQERLEKIRRGPGELIAHCRYIAETTVVLLKNVGISARSVEFIAYEQKFPNIRHTVSEAVFNDQRIHLDTDVGILFVDRDYLSSLDVAESLHHRNLKPEHLRSLVVRKKINEEEYPYLREIIEDGQKLLKWYENMAVAMMIGTDFYTPNQNLGEAVRMNIIDSKKETAQLLSRADFMTKYYA